MGFALILHGLFGNNSQTAASDIVQSVTNNILQTSAEQCTSSCSQVQSGNTIICIDCDASVIGETAQCEANAACTMNQNLDSQIKVLMKAYSKQAQKIQHSIFDFGSLTRQSISSTIDQNINNQVTQILSSECQANSDTIQRNNITYVNGNTGKADVIGLSSTGNAEANCMMQNLGKSIAFTTSVATNDQDQSFENAFASIIIAIVLMLVLGGIVLIIVLGLFGGGAAVVATKTLAGSSSKSTTPSAASTAAKTIASNPDLLTAAAETAAMA